MYPLSYLRATPGKIFSRETEEGRGEVLGEAETRTLKYIKWTSGLATPRNIKKAAPHLHSK
jgi:hypothetical protein